MFLGTLMSIFSLIKHWMSSCVPLQDQHNKILYQYLWVWACTLWSTLLSSATNKFIPRFIFEKCIEWKKSIPINCLHRPNPILLKRFIIFKIILLTNRQWSSTTFKTIFRDSKYDICSQWEWWTPQGRKEFWRVMAKYVDKIYQ
jgi:hypothetical protein